MISTLGEAHDLGWPKVYCRFGKCDGMNSVRECNANGELGLPTLVYARA